MPLFATASPRSVGGCSEGGGGSRVTPEPLNQLNIASQPLLQMDSSYGTLILSDIQFLCLSLSVHCLCTHNLWTTAVSTVFLTVLVCWPLSCAVACVPGPFAVVYEPLSVFLRGSI